MNVVGKIRMLAFPVKHHKRTTFWEAGGSHRITSQDFCHQTKCSNNSSFCSTAWRVAPLTLHHWLHNIHIEQQVQRAHKSQTKSADRNTTVMHLSCVRRRKPRPREWQFSPLQPW